MAGIRKLLLAALCVLAVLGAATPALAKPTFAGAAPANGSTVMGSPSVITVNANDPQRRAMTNPYFRLDGIVMAGTFTQAGGVGTFKYVPPAPLAAGKHEVYVAVTDSYNQRGYSTWTFYVSTDPSLSKPTPTPGSLVSTRTPEISALALNAGPAPVIEMFVDEQLVPHSYDAATGMVRSLSVPRLTDEATHTARLTLTNGTRSTSLSWNFVVQTRQEMAQTSCKSCHPGEPIPPHPMENCDACHFSPGPIGDCGSCHGWGTHPAEFVARVSCETCHNPQWPQVPQHDDAKPLHTSTIQDSCSACHSRSLGREHASRTDDAGVAYDCTDCHMSTDERVTSAISNNNTSCSACHGSYGDQHYTAVNHVASAGTQEDSSGFTCGSCHDMDLMTEHQKASSSSSGRACDTCHPSPRDGFGAWTGGCDQCHSQRHSAAATAHAPLATNASCTEAGCHGGKDLAALHSTATTTAAGESRRSCRVCHAGAVPSTKDCTACHGLDGHPDIPSKHAATPASATVTVLGAELGTHACAECHSSLSLTTIHASCSTCHPGAVNSVRPWNGGCATGSCHTPTSTMPQHQTIDSAHAVSTGTCTAAGCHAGAGNSAAVHGSQGCASCHGAGKTPTNTCSSCHSMSAPHGDETATHRATIGSGYVHLFDNHDGDGSYDTYVDCTMCHANSNLIEIHARDCSVCHPGPRNTFTTWNKGCQQGGCHVQIHRYANEGHEAEYRSNDCESHCHNSDWSVPAENCMSCHTSAPDTVPPTTSHLPNSSLFVGPTLVTLTGVDNAGPSAVKDTYYRLDGGALQLGESVAIPAPASGTAAHTLEYWSMDWSRNRETTRTALFTVSADTLPPTTTSNAVSSYTGPASIRLTATDNGTRGVARTYYRIDDGERREGQVVTVPQPDSGTRGYTLSFWSEDWSGNVESTKTVSFSITADRIAPTTTHSIPAYIRTSGMYAVFSPVDPAPSSGIAAVRLKSTTVSIGTPTKQTNGTWQAWMNMSYQGTRTIDFSAVDGAGNAEATKTASFCVDWTPPVTYTGALASYTGTATFSLTPNDTHSGPATTMWRIDAGAWQSGTTVTVTPPSNGTVQRTVYYYSTDKAGNTETQKSKAISMTAAVDVTAPNGTMAVAAGAANTSSTAVSVHSNIVDGQSGMSQMRVDPGTGVYGIWVAYSADYAINLPSGDGMKTVNVQYRDVAGNVLTLTDTISLDTTPPSGTMSIENGALQTTTTAVAISADVSDSGSGLAEMRIDPGDGAYGEWIPYASTYGVKLPAGDGAKTAKAQYRDVAGNVLTLTDSILLESPSETRTFVFTGANQTFTVPGDVSQVTVNLYGAQGGAAGSDGGLGGHVRALVPVQPGQTLTVRVGGSAGFYSEPGGWPNGGGGDGDWGSGGGGSSSILLGSTVLAEAGGGGGGGNQREGGAGGLLPATLPGGNAVGGSGGAGGGGGWNGGAQSDGMDQGGAGGTSYIAAGTGTMTPGMNAGNGTVTISWVTADINAPLTTSDAQPWYRSLPVNINLTADDFGGSGVASTTYKLNGGVATNGTVVSVNSTGTHTLSFWSVDQRGNRETTKTATFGIDTAAPETTCTAVAGRAYNGAQTFTLGTKDDLSGVATTKYRIDGGGWQTGKTINVAQPTSGQSAASHTIEWYSTDVAGNTEATGSVSFSIVPVGTIVFAWDPPGGSFTEYWVYDATGKLIASTYNETGWFTVTVPVSSQPYRLETHWYDAGMDWEDWTSNSALIDEPGETFTWRY